MAMIGAFASNTVSWLIPCHRMIRNCVTIRGNR